MIYQIARTLSEAKQQAVDGFGYQTQAAAEKALGDPEIDMWYRQQLRIFKTATPPGRDE